MNEYPYFRWFAKDAETDLNWRLMSYAQRGFFMTCLDLAWINNGIPSDLDELAILMNCNREELDYMWIRVGKCFIPSGDPLILVNKRQLKDLEELKMKSEKASHAGKLGGRPSGKADAKQTKSERLTDEKRTLSERLTRARDRADSGAGSGIDAEVISSVVVFDFENAFDELWKLYPAKGRSKRILSQQYFIAALEAKTDPAESFAAMTKPLRPGGKWLISDQWGRGFVGGLAEYLHECRWDEDPPASNGSNGHDLLSNYRPTKQADIPKDARFAFEDEEDRHDD